MFSGIKTNKKCSVTGKFTGQELKSKASGQHMSPQKALYKGSIVFLGHSRAFAMWHTYDLTKAWIHWMLFVAS